MFTTDSLVAHPLPQRPTRTYTSKRRFRSASVDSAARPPRSRHAASATLHAALASRKTSKASAISFLAPSSSFSPRPPGAPPPDLSMPAPPPRPLSAEHRAPEWSALPPCACPWCAWACEWSCPPPPQQAPPALEPPVPACSCCALLLLSSSPLPVDAVALRRRSRAASSCTRHSLALRTPTSNYFESWRSQTGTGEGRGGGAGKGVVCGWIADAGGGVEAEA